MLGSQIGLLKAKPACGAMDRSQWGSKIVGPGGDSAYFIPCFLKVGIPGADPGTISDKNKVEEIHFN